MWTADGQRVTASPAFMPDAPADVRARYRQHARGNGLYRNLGNGRFEDVSVKARATMGRWAWSSDALDFDSDGFDDLYVANGMLTRTSTDVEGFFWRQVVAQSPLTPVKGTPYDEAWRAMNQLLIHDSIAGRQRNVLLHNDGRGGFDEVSGTAGLDLEQDGRSFAVLDVENLRMHYARTLEYWLERFERSYEQVQSQYGPQFARMWRLYLAGSIAGGRRINPRRTVRRKHPCRFRHALADQTRNPRTHHARQTRSPESGLDSGAWPVAHREAASLAAGEPRSVRAGSHTTR